MRFCGFPLSPPNFFYGCLLDNFWYLIFGLCGGQKNVYKGIKACRHPDKGNVSSFFDVVMLVILLHSLCTCQEQSQNVGTFLSKKSWLRVRAKKWQICVGSRLHILCYSGSIRVWASPYRLVHSEVTLTKNALKKCPCQICLKIYMRSKTLFLEIYTFSSVSTATEWKSGPVGCCCRCYPGRILSPHSSAPRSDQRSPRRRGRKWWRIIHHWRRRWTREPHTAAALNAENSYTRPPVKINRQNVSAASTPRLSSAQTQLGSVVFLSRGEVANCILTSKTLIAEVIAWRSQ